MDTLSWLELLLFVGVIVGTLCYHFGHAIGHASGMQQVEKDKAERRASMLRHPSYHLRVKDLEE